MAKSNSPQGGSAGRQSDDWRLATIARIRSLIEQADPEVVEERKWAKATNPEGVPTWYHEGIICTGEIYKTHVKVTFARGASLDDPSHLLTPASKATSGAPSTSVRARGSTRSRSRPSSGRP